MGEKILPTPEQLRELLRYEPETGKLFWKHRTPQMFKEGRRSAEGNCNNWNSKWSGSEAFTARCSNGYATGRVWGRQFFAHRVIWALVHGVWTENLVDHVNGDKSDNRIENLRIATHSQNEWNSGARSNNKTGVKGVCAVKGRDKFSAEIRANGISHKLGHFQTIEDAAEARRAAAERLHGEFVRHG